MSSHLQNLQQKHQQLKEFVKRAYNTYTNFDNETEIKILKKQKLLLKEKIQQLSGAEIFK